MAKTAILALFALIAVGSLVSEVSGRAYEIAIPPGTNCNKSCYKKAGLLPTKKILFKQCGVSGVKILSTTAPNIADMKAVCLTYIYHQFPSPDAMVKYQNCEANKSLYNKNMLAVKAPGNFWGVDGKPPKFSAC